jgi:hypothetical protein
VPSLADFGGERAATFAKSPGRPIRQAACEMLEERRLPTIWVDAISPGPTRGGTTLGNAYAACELQ